jgi:hypothetical protein
MELYLEFQMGSMEFHLKFQLDINGALFGVPNGLNGIPSGVPIRS